MLARQVYEAAVARLVARLGDKDFEVLTDLILGRSGWACLAKLGGVTEEGEDRAWASKAPTVYPCEGP